MLETCQRKGHLRYFVSISIDFQVFSQYVQNKFLNTNVKLEEYVIGSVSMISDSDGSISQTDLLNKQQVDSQ